MKLKPIIATFTLGLMIHTLNAAGYPTQNIRASSLNGIDYVLADSIGKTLYTFDPDPIDGTASACNGKCAEIWPPVLLNDEEAESLPAVGRADKDGREAARLARAVAVRDQLNSLGHRDTQAALDGDVMKRGRQPEQARDEPPPVAVDAERG